MEAKQLGFRASLYLASEARQIETRNLLQITFCNYDALRPGIWDSLWAAGVDIRRMVAFYRACKILNPQISRLYSEGTLD